MDRNYEMKAVREPRCSLKGISYLSKCNW